MNYPKSPWIERLISKGAKNQGLSRLEGVAQRLSSTFGGYRCAANQFSDRCNHAFRPALKMPD
jgi:hypothetical protein